MHLGFTGTQTGMSQGQIVECSRLMAEIDLKEGTSMVTFHHGDCIGADETAHVLAESYGFYIVGHPPTNPKKRAFKVCQELRPELDYLKRNQAMVGECDVLIAAPSSPTEERRSGTWATVRYARRKGIPIYVLSAKSSPA